MDPLSQLPIPLLAWYRDNARDLPWRRDPDPYRVWVSEIMLQQTRVAAVLGYYARFLDAFPTVADLAAGEEEKLMKLWQGLGYYSRARNLQKAARQIMDRHGGVFPSDYRDIRALAGDFLYGTEDPALPNRFALHSASLTLRQPVTGQVLALTSPLPDELYALLQEN